MKMVEPSDDLASVVVGARRYDGLKFTGVIKWTVYGRGWGGGMPPDDRDNIAKKVGALLDNPWLTFEKKVKVTIGDGPPKDLAIRIETQFGADEDPAPHRRAVKRGD